MKHIPSYTKILNLGSAGTEKAFDGDVVVQEKVDGSQFRFGVNEEGKVLVASKKVSFENGCDNDMFLKGYEFVMNSAAIASLPSDTYIFGEYLQSPRHNSLEYGRTPKNNIVIFDCLINGKWMSREELEELANRLEVDVIPQYAVGNLTPDGVRAMLGKQSFLGNAEIEGVVVKNYTQTLLLGGQVFPLFTKFVSEKFKEVHGKNKEYQPRKSKLQDLIDSYRTEARWEKAFQHLRDSDELELDPRDIPKLMASVGKDIHEEEAENIKEELFKIVWKDINRKATAGLPEWYKQKLLNRLNNP